MKKTLLTIAFLLIAFSSLECQTTEGTEFWLCFQQNYKTIISVNKVDDPHSRLNQKLFIASRFDCNISIDIKKLHYHNEISIKAGEAKVVELEQAVQLTINESPQTLGIHILSDAPISINGLSSRLQTTDSYTALPVDMLGTDYIVASYNNTQGLYSQAAVVATENDSEIEIISTANSESGIIKHLPYKIILNRGDVYQFAAAPNGDSNSDSSDLTGTQIKSSKKIAVFSGHQCSYVTRNIIACNHLIEQLLPVKLWGTDFIIAPLKGRKSSVVRIITSSENTKVKFNQRVIMITNKSEFKEFETGDSAYSIDSDKPICVMQFGMGFKSDSIGDPMMMTIRPKNLYCLSYIITTPKEGTWKHYVNLYGSLEALTNIRINGKEINDKGSIPMKCYSNYYRTIQLEYGAYLIESSEKFGLSQYGFGTGADGYDSYGNY